MFTKNVNGREKGQMPGGSRGRGRPPGRTPQGAAARQRLYEIAVALIAERGYEAATLREVADRAGVSVGLLYRYFPSKRAVVLALYDDLSAEYADRAAAMPAGKWRERFMFALTTSLEVLGPHRPTLAALTPILVGDVNEGLFSPATAFSRQRVQRVFHAAVGGASDAPRAEVTAAVGRLLYLGHLGVILWWLLDKSPQQRATTALVALVKQALPASALTLRFAKVRSFVLRGDRLFREALFEDHAASPL
jgi:AcrR family transcriptional regulator